MNDYITLATYAIIFVSTIAAAYLKVLPDAYVPAIFAGLLGVLLPSPIKPTIPPTTQPPDLNRGT